MKEPKLKYEPETAIEIYYFNKWQSSKVELRHLRTERGKNEAYIQELESKLLDPKGSVTYTQHKGMCYSLQNEIAKLKAKIKRLEEEKL